MLRILTSLSFLYALTILLLLLYAFAYYRDFTRSRRQRRIFPFVFFIISAACFAFLWINIHAPLKLRTFSNLDHHFIQHDGFTVTGSIELGRSDTVNNSSNSFNRFVFEKKNGIVKVNAAYSEDPLYASGENGYHILSVTYPAAGHIISFQNNGLSASIRTVEDDLFELKAGENIFQKRLKLKIGSTAWNIFRDEDAFINSVFYNNENLVAFLKNVQLIRDDVSKGKSGELKYFLSGRLFRYAGQVNYDDKKIKLADQQFRADLPDQSLFAWGIVFLNNNQNQFRVKYNGMDSFLLLNRYPVSYPLTEENRDNWDPHYVSKFLLSDPKEIQQVPAVFGEGFLFSSFNGDSTTDFSPVLLSYYKAAKNDSLKLKARWLNNTGKEISLKDNGFVLPAKSFSRFGWTFSVRNTYDWDFGNRILSAKTWQVILFGSLGFFCLLVFFTSIVKPVDKLSWIWQLLSCVTIVMLTTRFFLYWRYKSFPPYEAMDLPSQQQLQSLGNFAIIVFAAVGLAIIFGFSFLKYSYWFLKKIIATLLKKPYHEIYSNENIPDGALVKQLSEKLPLAALFSKRFWFFSTWVAVLIICGAIAAVSHFDPGICRHLAIGLIIIYFIFLFVSYKHSPLVTAATHSWWKIGTGRTLDVLISNPVKVLLSVSLLTLFVFIDIGFAIVFLNFLLFNEAFLCINYAIAGLSAGSKNNARLFGILGGAYLISFILNLLYAPYIFKFLLELPQSLYVVIYVLFAVGIAYLIARLLVHLSRSKRIRISVTTAVIFFAVAFFLFPKERILDKAAMTKYRIDVLTTPVEKAIESAYTDGKTYEPVIRAAQNQWFINTFIYEENNPNVNSFGFNLLAHAPQNKGAKYNAQATDLVASRFFIAEHGKWSVLLYVLLLLLPTTMLASFYKLYPDFTNRINNNYPTITAGFSVLNYLLIAALLVILAATGRYIFFGQDLPFGSILSKQSILFPCIIILLAIRLFKNITPEHYANRKKIIPGVIIFLLLAVLLFLVKPSFNKNKEFNVANLAKDMDSYIQLRLQPVLDYFDTVTATRRLSIAKKDQLFTDSVRKMIAMGQLDDGNKFFANEITAYARSGFSRHLDQRRMFYLDLYSGNPQLAVNDNYFRVEPPPHLQHLWKGNIFGDTTVYNVSLWNAGDGSVIAKKLTAFTNEPDITFTKDLQFSFRSPAGENIFRDLYLLNKSPSVLHLKYNDEEITLRKNDSLKLFNPSRISISDSVFQHEQVLTIEPDALMKNYYVNGSRFYMYPLANHFIWARNFAEAVSSDYTANTETKRNAFVSIDVELMDSLSAKIRVMMMKDTAYKKGAEYGICIADGNGRLVAMSDFIKGMNRPDPNDKAGFNKVILGEDGYVSQSLLRKQIGNINLLRLNPGPGSTLKPVVFSAIASQLPLDWDAFSTEGFSVKQHYYGSEKVPEYDFEKNNGKISRVTDYLKYSDNYYHSNVLLLGSYPKQELKTLLAKNFVTQNPETGLHWPYFNYGGTQYWLDGFENWPGYLNGKANFGMDNSFTSIGLLNNFGIYTRNANKSFDMFASSYDSLLFLNAYRRSGFILPEYSLFDQYGENINHKIPFDLFLSCFRGHVKGSSQVMIPPAKMVEAFGRMITQSRNYSLTLNPYAGEPLFSSFDVDKSIPYNNYLSIIRENVFTGMREALFKGTASGLGNKLKNGEPYYYYAKTGTTGDDEINSKSKLFAIVISLKDVTDPDFNFRKNKFYTIYFTSQNGPAKQNEAFQAEVIKYLQKSRVFKKYMETTK